MWTLSTIFTWHVTDFLGCCFHFIGVALLGPWCHQRWAWVVNVHESLRHVCVYALRKYYIDANIKAQLIRVCPQRFGFVFVCQRGGRKRHINGCDNCRGFFLSDGLVTSRIQSCMSCTACLMHLFSTYFLVSVKNKCGKLNILMTKLFK